MVVPATSGKTRSEGRPAKTGRPFRLGGYNSFMPALLSRNPKENIQIAKMLLEHIKKSDPSQAAVIALFGNLGAGKTTLAQIIASELGVKDTVKSPTFLILETYPISFDHFHRFVHVDAYRLDSPQELANLGFADFLKDSGNLIVIEWPEKAGPFVPEKATRVSLKFIDENTREIAWH